MRKKCTTQSTKGFVEKKKDRKRKHYSTSSKDPFPNSNITERIEDGLRLQRAKVKLTAESLRGGKGSSISVQSTDIGCRNEKKEEASPRIYPSNLLYTLQTREIGYSNGTSLLKRWNPFHKVILSERLHNIRHCLVDASEQIIDLSYQENRGIVFCDKNKVVFLGSSKDPSWTMQSLTPSKPLNERVISLTFPSIWRSLSHDSYFTSVLWNEGLDSHLFATLHRHRVKGNLNGLSLFDSNRMEANTFTIFGNSRVADMDFELHTSDTGQEAICWRGKSSDLLSCGQAGIVMHEFDRKKSYYQLSIAAINAAVSVSTSRKNNACSYNAACRCLPVCMTWVTERGVLLFGLRSGGVLMADGRLDGRRSSSGSCSLVGALPFRVDHLQSLDVHGSILASDVVGSLQLFDMRISPRGTKYSGGSDVSSGGRVVRECKSNATNIRQTDIKGRFFVTKDRRAVLLPAPPSSPSSSSSSSSSSLSSESPSSSNLLAYSLTDENTPLNINANMESVIPVVTAFPASSTINFGSVAGDTSDAIVGFVNHPIHLMSIRGFNESAPSSYSMIFKSPSLFL